MKSFIPKHHRNDGPEGKIQVDVEDMLRREGWLVMRTHGNMFSVGWPDDYATHSRYGPRWIEIKNPESFSFTAAQLEFFPKLVANGSGVWILVAATQVEYEKLFAKCNWWQYLPEFRNQKRM